MHLPKRKEDIARWESLGDYKARLVEVYQKLADLYAEMFPRQQVALHITLPMPGLERETEAIVKYGVEKYPRQFVLQSDQLHGRSDNAEMFSYEVIMNQGQGVRKGFQSLASFAAKDPRRQGTIELAVYNFVRADGEFWELWHGDGMSEKVCAQLLQELDRARRMGHEHYKEELVRSGKYHTPEEDNYREVEADLKKQKDGKKKSSPAS